MGLLGSLLEDFLNAHLDYSLPARIAHNKVIVPFYYESNIEAGVGVGFTDYAGSEFFVNGYARNNDRMVFKKVNHDCRIGKKSGFLGALLFLDNVIRFIDNTNYSINFRFIPNLFESIREAEVEVGIINSSLLDTYFGILNEELSVQLNDFISGGFELTDMRVKSLYSTLVNLLNLPLSKNQHSMIINSLNRVDFLPLIKSMIPLAKLDDIGFYSLINDLESLRDALTSRLSSLSDSIKVIDPSMNNKKRKMINNQRTRTNSSSNPLNKTDLSKLKLDLTLNLDLVFKNALGLRSGLVDLLKKPSYKGRSINDTPYDIVKDNNEIEGNIYYLDRVFSNADIFFKKIQDSMEGLNGFALKLKHKINDMKCYSYQIVDYDLFNKLRYDTSYRGTNYAKEKLFPPMYDFKELCALKEQNLLIRSLRDLIYSLDKASDVSFSFNFKSSYNNKSYKLNKRKLLVTFHANDFLDLTSSDFMLKKLSQDVNSLLTSSEKDSSLSNPHLDLDFELPFDSSVFDDFRSTVFKNKKNKKKNNKNKWKMWWWF